MAGLAVLMVPAGWHVVQSPDNGKLHVRQFVVCIVVTVFCIGRSFNLSKF